MERNQEGKAEGTLRNSSRVGVGKKRERSPSGNEKGLDSMKVEKGRLRPQLRYDLRSVAREEENK